MTKRRTRLQAYVDHRKNLAAIRRGFKIVEEAQIKQSAKETSKERDPGKTHLPQPQAGERTDGPLGEKPRPGMALSLSPSPASAPCAEGSERLNPAGRPKESSPPPPELSAGDPFLSNGEREQRRSASTPGFRLLLAMLLAVGE